MCDHPYAPWSSPNIFFLGNVRHLIQTVTEEQKRDFN